MVVSVSAAVRNRSRRRRPCSGNAIRADGGRQGEDDVVVGNRQEFGLATFEPLPRRGRLALRAMRLRQEL